MNENGTKNGTKIGAKMATLNTLNGRFPATHVSRVRVPSMFAHPFRMNQIELLDKAKGTWYLTIYP